VATSRKVIHWAVYAKLDSYDDHAEVLILEPFKITRSRAPLKRKTRRDRMQAKLRMIGKELRGSMHQPIPVQGQWLKQVVTGYFNYHSVPTNGLAHATFRYFVIELWQRTLRRRGQKDGTTWERITRLADDWLPKPHILHPWPQARFECARNPLTSCRWITNKCQELRNRSLTWIKAARSRKSGHVLGHMGG
jgi:hypothetical protein